MTESAYAPFSLEFSRWFSVLVLATWQEYCGTIAECWFSVLGSGAFQNRFWRPVLDENRRPGFTCRTCHPTFDATLNTLARFKGTEIV